MSRDYPKSQRRSANARLPVLIGSLLAGAVFVCLALWFFWPGTPVAAEAVGRPIADGFLANVLAGQVDAAWESTSAEFKSDEGRDSFRRFVAQHPVLRAPLNFEAYEDISLNGLQRAQCVYAPAAATSPIKVRVVVGLDVGVWKVDGVFVE